MNGPLEGYITLQEAADLLGVSRQTVTRRALSTDKSLDGPRTALDGNLDSLNSTADSKPASIVQGGKRYISKDFLDYELNKPGTEYGPDSTAYSTTDTKQRTADSTAYSKPRALEQQLAEARSEIAALKAANEAQQAHIADLKQLLDREQTIRLAAEQPKLTDGRGGLFAWLRRKGNQ